MGAKSRPWWSVITSDHANLLETFKVQRQAEMALLTPVQQGKFLMTLKKWHEEMCMRYEKQEKK